MAATDAQTTSGPSNIAPMLVAPSTDHGAEGNSLPPKMPYSCQSCAKRKVKCDKVAPLCSSCRKVKLECIYQVPPPRRRKRNLSGDINERLARYERILHEHGLLPEDNDTSLSTDETLEEPISLRWNDPETSKTGKLLTGQGKSRYIDSRLWRDLGDDAMQHMSDDEGEDQLATGVASDPLTGAILGSRQSLLQYYPTYAESIMLWKTYIENIEPLCKVLHVPSTNKMVEMASKQPEMTSKADECLLFAIYHFSVFSMVEEECAKNFGHSRDTLMQRYHYATRQALVNASFLKTTEVSTMQALVLFLLPCRYFYDPHTYWILTGVAVRIAQRMGLHRDGEKLGLPPFDVQMRRRLFYQLLPLDGAASQMSGTGIGIVPDSWDTQRPFNINDDQIWPGMTEKPEEQKGATEMIFCLARSCIGQFIARAGRSTHGGGPSQSKDYKEIEQVICEAENEVEERYIRYCDIVNPLHVLTIGFARSAISALRLRTRLPKVRNQTVTDLERKELFELSQKIIDIDTATYDHMSLKKHSWYVRSFWAWGSWDSLVFTLTSLPRSDLLCPAESDGAWRRVDRVYDNHRELLESKQALHTAVRRLTLKAWSVNPPSSIEQEPPFIARLRFLIETNTESRTGGQDGVRSDTSSLNTPSSADDANALFGGIPERRHLDVREKDFDLETADWVFWDQMIKDYQAQGVQQ